MTLNALTTHDLTDMGRKIDDAAVIHRPAVLFHPMALTDCCRLYGAILRSQPKTAEKCTMIALSFLRDSIKAIAFIFVDSAVNLGDVGTKDAGSLAILGHYLKTCRFALAFLGRQKRGL